MRGSRQRWSWLLPPGPQDHRPELLPPWQPVRPLLLPIWIPIPLPGRQSLLPWHYLGHLRFVFCLEPFYLSLRLVVGHGHGQFKSAACKPTIYVHCCCCFQPTVANARAKLFFKIQSLLKIKRRPVLLRTLLLVV